MVSEIVYYYEVPFQGMSERSRCLEALPYQDHKNQGTILERGPLAVLSRVTGYVTRLIIILLLSAQQIFMQFSRFSYVWI
jgi:hypothetical protein